MSAVCWVVLLIFDVLVFPCCCCWLRWDRLDSDRPKNLEKELDRFNKLLAPLLSADFDDLSEVTLKPSCFESTGVNKFCLTGESKL